MTTATAACDPFWSLCERVRAGGWLVHGSPWRVAGPLEPRQAPGEPRAWVHASDSVLTAGLHGLLKWLQAGLAEGALPDPAVRAGLYRLAGAGPASRALCFVSVHQAVAPHLDPDHPLWLHLCPPAPFNRRQRSLVSRRTGGLVRGASEWIATAPVMPVDVVPLRLRDLPCAIALHGSGTGQLRALLRHPVADKLVWGGDGLTQPVCRPGDS
jgi:hypothetical protein